MALASGLEPVAPRWLAADEALVADPHPDRVEEHQRVAGVERAALPFGHLLQDRTRHRRDEVRRDVDPVKLLEMVTDRARAHATRVHRDDLVVEVGEAPLVLGNQLRVERPRSIARDVQAHLGRARQHRLGRRPVAPVRPAGRLRVALLRAQVVVQLGIQDALGERLLQVVQQPVTGEQLGRVAPLQQPVQ